MYLTPRVPQATVSNSTPKAPPPPRGAQASSFATWLDVQGADGVAPIVAALGKTDAPSTEQRKFLSGHFKAEVWGSAEWAPFRAQAETVYANQYKKWAAANPEAAASLGKRKERDASPSAEAEVPSFELPEGCSWVELKNAAGATVWAIKNPGGQLLTVRVAYESADAYTAALTSDKTPGQTTGYAVFLADRKLARSGGAAWPYGDVDWANLTGDQQQLFKDKAAELNKTRAPSAKRAKTVAAAAGAASGSGSGDVSPESLELAE